jgi:hypothetical protein
MVFAMSFCSLSLLLRKSKPLYSRSRIDGAARAAYNQDMGAIVPREELEAAVRARRELGPEYEDAVVESLVEKIEQQLAERERAREPAELRHPQVALASLGMAIPLLAIAGLTAGLAGVIAVCVAIVLVNLLAAWRR